MAKHTFSIGDYVVFAMTIAVSIGIGIFYAISGGRQKTTSEYLVGGRAMQFLPTAISLLVSFESSIMMLGLPAEAYVYGMQYVIGSAGFLISQLLAVYVVVPLLHPLKVTSAYEYLEYRFKSRGVRLLGTLLGILTYAWYMGIVLFGPAVALEAVTGFPLWGSIFVIAFVSVIYTSIGGIKAVIWTDVFQAFVMFMGIFAILIKGTIEVGGPKKVWDIAERGGRLNFFNFDPDPRTRHTFWNLFVGSLIRGFGLGFNQSTVQRISSTKTMNEARRMLLLVAPAFFVSLSLACYEGVVTYSYYETKKCDPLESDQISDPNQLVPFVVMDIFENLPGMPGLFLASLFSASLSTLSSGLSSLAALLWADIVKPAVGDRLSESMATFLTKISVVIFGIIACGIALLVSEIGGTLTQIAGSLISAFAGPLTGIFFLGCFFPRSNAKGTIIGGTIALVFCTWLSMGMNFSPAIKKTPWLPHASVDNCPGSLINGTAGMYTTASDNNTFTTASTAIVDTTTVETSPALEPQGVEVIYTVSYNWIAVIGIIGTVVLGNFFSFLTGMNKPGDVDPRYILSMSETLLICLPRPIKKGLSGMGTQFMDPVHKAKFPEPRHKDNVLDYEEEFDSILTSDNKGKENDPLNSIGMTTTNNVDNEVKEKPVDNKQNGETLSSSPANGNSKF